MPIIILDLVHNMTTAAPRWALVLLVSLSAGAAADRSSPGAQPPRLLSGGEQLEALVLATEAEALRRAIDSPAWAQERLHVCTRQLEDLLDDGGTTSRDPNELRRSLAASVAAADAPAPSVKTRLARVLTLVRVLQCDQRLGAWCAPADSSTLFPPQVNIAWFCGALLIAVAAAALLGAYAAALVMLVPLPAWEAAGYLLSIWVLRAATRAVPSAAPYLALTGLMLLTACMGSSIALHDLARRFEAHKEAATSALLALLSSLYGAAAVRLQVGLQGANPPPPLARPGPLNRPLTTHAPACMQAPLLGTLSVWWAMAALGFFVAVLPFCTLVGFRSGMARPFAAALLLILAFLPFKVRRPGGRAAALHMAVTGSEY